MKAIPGYAGYFCDEHGRIFSTRSGKLIQMKTRINRHGYETVTLSLDGTPHYPTVHRLVLSTWGGPANGLHCNHKNGNRADNRAENLEWVTRAENEQHARRVLGKMLHGEHHPVAKMTPDTVRELRDLRDQGWTFASLAARYGIGISQTCRIAKREKWAHI